VIVSVVPSLGASSKTSDENAMLRPPPIDLKTAILVFELLACLAIGLAAVPLMV
jgi:hypothetical protein